MKRFALSLLLGAFVLCPPAIAQYAESINPWTRLPDLGAAGAKDVVNHKGQLDIDHLWVVGNDGLVKYMIRDVNGTEYWHTPNSLGISNASDYNFNSICFLKSSGMTNYGWLAGESKSDYSGILLRTTDYGSNWVQVLSIPLLPAGTAFRSVSFAEDGKGYIACGNGVILKSSDYGVNWTKTGSTPVSGPNEVSIWYQSIYTQPDNSNYVRVAGDAFGIVDSSLDGGATWSGNPTVRPIDNSYYEWPDNTSFDVPLALAPFKMGHKSWLDYTVPYNHGYLFSNDAFSQPVEKPIWLYASDGYETVGSDGEILNVTQLGYDLEVNCVARQVTGSGYVFKYAGTTGGSSGTRGLYGTRVPLPGLIMSSSAGATSIDLSWGLMSAPTNVKEYRIYRAIQGSIARPLIVTEFPSQEGSFTDNVPYMTTYEYWLGIVLNVPADVEKYYYFGALTPTGSLPPLPARPPQPRILALEDVADDHGEVVYIKVDEYDPTPGRALIWYMRNDAVWPDTHRITPTGVPKSITREIYDTVQTKTYTYVVEYTGTDENPDDIVPSLPTISAPVTVIDNLAPARLPAPTYSYDALSKIIDLYWPASTDEPNLGGYWVCPEPAGEFGSQPPSKYTVFHASPIERTTYRWTVPPEYQNLTVQFHVTAMDRSGNIAPWSPYVWVNTKAFTSTSYAGATAHNNGRKLLYDRNERLHLAYASGDSVRYQYSDDDGYAWSGPNVSGPGFASGGINPSVSIALYGDDVDLAWKAEAEEHAGWILKTARRTGNVWGEALTIAEQPGGWDRLHYISPPTMTAGASGTHLAFERYDRYYSLSGPGYRWDWSLLYGFRSVGSDAFTWTVLDSASGQWTPPIQDPTSPSICLDSKGGIHITWDRDGEVWWRMYDPYQGKWLAKANLTQSPGVESAEPSLAFHGDVHLVWQEGNDVHHRYGNWGYAPREKGLPPAGGFYWAEAENVSTNPATPSLWPVYDGGYVAWSEEMPSGVTEAYCAHYSDFLWKQIPEFSKNPTQPSNFPQIAYRQNTDGNRMVTVWTEGTGPLYSLIARDTAGQVTPTYSAILGGEEPSIYTIERDGYLTFEGGISVDYDSTELQYYLPYLDAGQETSIELVFYQPSAKANIQHKVYINDIPLGVVNIPAGELYTFSKRIPPAAMKDGDGKLRIENKKGVYAACAKWQLFAYDRATGRGGKGGSQAELGGEKPIAYRYELLQNAPNPFSKTTAFRYQLAKPGRTSLKVYNTLGQVVKTMVDSDQQPGLYSINWDGKDNQGRQVANGVYLYRLSAGSFTDTKKMVMVR